MESTSTIKSLLLEESHYFNSMINNIPLSETNQDGFEKLLGGLFNSRTQLLEAIDHQDYMAPTKVEMPTEVQAGRKPSLAHLSHALVIVDAKIADTLAIRQLQGFKADEYFHNISEPVTCR